jgi:hypothetical protein
VSDDVRSDGYGRLPEVIVDFEVRDGLLYVSLRNVGDAGAYEVTTRFDPTFKGLAGQKDIAGMSVFRKTEFMAPGKAFVQLVDSFASYVSTPMSSTTICLSISISAMRSRSRPRARPSRGRKTHPGG